MNELTGLKGSTTSPKFKLGRIWITCGIEALVAERRFDLSAILQRHVVGDWGDLDDEDGLANDAWIERGSRLLSSYRINASLTVWVITEADRSVTTVLLPSEY